MAINSSVNFTVNFNPLTSAKKKSIKKLFGISDDGECDGKCGAET